MLLGVRALDMASVFMMKDTVFWWPLGSLWRWLGGIPVNRRASVNIIRQAVEYFDANPVLRLVITPEGTRKQVDHWKLGFYWMAVGAGVPILMGFVDYKNKITGVGPLLYPTGDLEADFAKLRAFYEPQVGVTPAFKIRPGEAERMLRGLERAPGAQGPQEGVTPEMPQTSVPQ
jgi:1-acyl-sn-glycerol-3-phosphate acyltransferase